MVVSQDKNRASRSMNMYGGTVEETKIDGAEVRD